jgi:hypothetical protein
VLFVFNRPDHVKRTLEALSRNLLAQHSDIVIYSDGPKSDADQPKILQIREYLNTLSGFRSVRLIERSQNLGLSRSIILGVNEVLDKYGRAIVLEDDMLTSQYFLLYMNDALKLYEGENRVISIQGYVFPLRETLPRTFFLRGADCWGWATWKRGWDLFEPDGTILIAELKKKRLAKLFDYDGAWNYMEMLQSQVQGRNDSWAIRWHASAFLKEKFALYPNRSLVRNIGLDSSGTHCKSSRELDVDLTTQPIEVHRIAVEENIAARESIKAFLRSVRPSRLEKLKKVLSITSIKERFNFNITKKAL